eukprot:TRINITY_DN8639_c0_g1_i1.p1 TRINITY_DN8639_c0_g1~~TRINITY_DN8639_c0_g1_i1.p1  ORF type:complete len:488 (-),score=109.20 TRINITY_DN8639_c0_g1_i1:12-1364(-)
MWSKECRDFLPELDKFAEKVHGKFGIAKVDLEYDDGLAEDYGVNDIPVIKLVIDGKDVRNYDGELQTYEIEKFLKKASEPMLIVKTFQEIDEIKKNGLILAVFEDRDIRFEDFEDYFLHYKFEHHEAFAAIINSEMEGKSLYALLKNLKVDTSDFAVPSLIFFPRDREAEVAELTSPPVLKMPYINDDEIERWISIHTIPIFTHFTIDNFAEINEINAPVLVALLNPKSPDFIKQSTTMRMAAMKHRGKMFVGWLDRNNEAEFHHALTLGLTGEKDPELVIFDPEESESYHFPPEKEFTTENVDKFMVFYGEGSIAPYRKSEPVPDNTGKSVIDVVYDTWDELVMKEKRPVLVLFYSNNCDACREMEPEYRKTGEFFEKNHKVVVARYNAHHNRIPEGMEVNELPMLFGFPESGEPVLYAGPPVVQYLVVFGMDPDFETAHPDLDFKREL